MSIKTIKALIKKIFHGSAKAEQVIEVNAEIIEETKSFGIQKMKILVVDDCENNRKSAVQTLYEHDLTVVGSYDEALNEIQSTLVGDRPCYDVLLADLLMPAGGCNQVEDSKYVGQEMPVGWGLAIIAAKYKTKYVAVVSDTNHHYHPAAEIIFWIGSKVFTLYEAKALFLGHSSMVEIENSTDERGLQKGKDWAEALRLLTTEDEQLY